MGHRFKLNDLSPEQRADAERQLAGAPIFTAEGRAGLPAPLEPHAASRHTGPGGAKKGMSRNEGRFAEHLERERARDLVVGWLYEPLRVRLAARRASYCPDFWVWWSSNSDGPWGLGNAGGPIAHRLVAVEVKPRDRKTGRPYLREAGWLKARLAAELLDQLGVPLFLVWPAGRGKDVGWTWERVLPATKEA